MITFVQFGCLQYWNSNYLNQAKQVDITGMWHEHHSISSHHLQLYCLLHTLLCITGQWYGNESHGHFSSCKTTFPCRFSVQSVLLLLLLVHSCTLLHCGQSFASRFIIYLFILNSNLMNMMKSCQPITFFSSPILLKFCTEHGSIIAVRCTKFQNNSGIKKSWIKIWWHLVSS